MLAGSPFPVIGQAAQFLSRAGKTVFQKNLIKNLTLHYKISLNNLYLSTVLVQTYLLLIYIFLQFTIFVWNFSNLTPCAEMNQLQCQEKSLKPEEPHLAIGKRKEVFLLLLYSSIKQIFP